MLDERKEEAFCTILREELQLATGCTEPIAVAYCAARLRQVLGQRPCRILAEVSGNILKNVKSVVAHLYITNSARIYIKTIRSNGEILKDWTLINNT